jgi:hypothetical protein
VVHAGQFRLFAGQCCRDCIPAPARAGLLKEKCRYQDCSLAFVILEIDVVICACAVSQAVSLGEIIPYKQGAVISSRKRRLHVSLVLHRL